MQKINYVAMIMFAAIMAVSAIPSEAEGIQRDREEELREQVILLSTVEEMHQELDLAWQRIEQLEAENGQLNEQLNVAWQLPNVNNDGSDVTRDDNKNTTDQIITDDLETARRRGDVFVYGRNVYDTEIKGERGFDGFIVTGTNVYRFRGDEPRSLGMFAEQASQQGTPSEQGEDTTVLVEGDLIVYDNPVTINGDLIVTGNLFATNRLTVTGHLIVVGKVVALDLSVSGQFIHSFPVPAK